ncbi:MAG: hypothetical protein LBR86_00905 [Tannerella sp.]|jgi:hypothetical protein|nr:hypothetical protein [Tannerella sp.]
MLHIAFVLKFAAKTDSHLGLTKQKRLEFDAVALLSYKMSCGNGILFLPLPKSLISLRHEKKNHNTMCEFIAADRASGAKEI